ncbi:phosphoribosyltransferase [Hydrogenimonas sp.]
MERLYYDYATFREDLRALAGRIDEPFDAIVAVARGGMTMAHMLGELWDIRQVFALNAIGYDDTRKLERLEIFNLPDLHGAKRVLVVDDIADSGETLSKVMAALRDAHPDVAFRSATLFYKPRTSVFEPDYWLKEADAWIDFFWSEDLKG